MKKSIIKALPQLCLVTILIATVAVLEGLVSLTIKDIFDVVIQKDMDLFKAEAIKLLWLSLALLPVTILLAFGKGSYKRKSIVSLKVDFICKLFNKNINEFQKDNNSKYVSAITNDTNIIETSYINGIYGVIESIIKLIVSVVIITYISYWAMIAGIIICFISVFITIILSKPLQKHQTERSNLYEGYTSYIKEVLSAFHIIKTNNLNNKVKNDFNSKSTDIQQKGYVIDKLYTYIMAIQNLAFLLSFIGLFVITGFIAFKTGLSTGSVLLVVNSFEKIMHPVMMLGEMLPKIFSTKKIFIKLDGILKNEDNYEESITLEKFEDSINFQNVSFSYDDNEVLKAVDLSIKKGEKYLIVGPSGGGKTTILKLLRKYFLPKSGKILIDNMNLKDVTKKSYFKNVSNVEQQVFLFEDTLKNNMTLYKNYTKEEIESAVTKAGLKDFVEGLSQGLDTIIYDNGKNVSGGEKSRIAIARGLLTKTDIIFLDEAFANLDSEIAKEIESTLLDLDSITVVNVSHVIFHESKSKYDKIFVVKNKSVTSV